MRIVASKFMATLAPFLFVQTVFAQVIDAPIPSPPKPAIASQPVNADANASAGSAKGVPYFGRSDKIDIQSNTASKSLDSKNASSGKTRRRADIVRVHPVIFPIVSVKTEPKKPAANINLSSSSDHMEGLGLGGVELTVQVDAANEAIMPIALIVHGPGRVDPSLIDLHPGEVGRVTLRSTDVGNVQVIASASPSASGETSIRAVVPWKSLSASLLGALFGACAAVLGRQPRSNNVIRDVSESLIIGVVFFILYAVGINVLPMPSVSSTGLAWVFGISAAAALLGRELKNALTRTNATPK